MGGGWRVGGEGCWWGEFLRFDVGNLEVLRWQGEKAAGVKLEKKAPPRKVRTITTASKHPEVTLGVEFLHTSYMVERQAHKGNERYFYW